MKDLVTRFKDGGAAVMLKSGYRAGFNGAENMTDEQLIQIEAEEKQELIGNTMNLIPEIIRQRACPVAESIVAHIENSSKLSAAFLRMTEEAYCPQELAGTIEEWFEQKYENHVEVCVSWETHYADDLSSLFDAILQRAISSITNDQWQAIADHFWKKFWKERAVSHQL